jgi:hypothetical protein
VIVDIDVFKPDPSTTLCHLLKSPILQPSLSQRDWEQK